MRIIVVACLLAASSSAHADTSRDDKLEVSIVACERGEAKSCMKAAARMKSLDVHSRFGYTARDLRDRATALFALQCENSDAEACLAHGRRLIATDDAKRGYAQIERACSLGSGDACLEVGNSGNGKSADSRVMLDRACERGSARACVRLADQLQADKRPGSADQRRVALLYRKACEGNDMSGCLQSGIERLAVGDRPAAMLDFGKACDLGEVRGCDPAG